MHVDIDGRFVDVVVVQKQLFSEKQCRYDADVYEKEKTLHETILTGLLFWHSFLM